MSKEDEVKKYIRENWFKDHKAVLTKHGDLEVLDWKKPDSCIYAVRYVFDGSHMYITGDIGEALFNLTWKAGVNTFNDISTGYFMEKMKAFSDDRYDFCVNVAEESIREWKDRLIERDYELMENEEFDDFINELIGDLHSCSKETEWAAVINAKSDEIEEYDRDYWEWMYSIGREVPARILGYIVGLQMASEQLKEHEKISEMKNYSKACDQMENCEVCVKTMKDSDTPCTCMRKKYGESIWDYKESEVEQ